MKKKLRLVLTLLLACVLAVSLGMIVRQMAQYRANEASYAGAAEVARAAQTPASTPAAPSSESTPPGEEAEDSMLADAAQWARSLEALQAHNPDVVGWIEIPGTALSYPVLRTDNNDYYLNHTWEREYNAGGAIFADYRCGLDGSDFHTILYGHRMRNGSMFASLKYYSDASYWQAHPAVYLADETGVHIYDIFAAWEPSVTSLVYEFDLDTEAQRQAFVDACLAGSRLETGIVPGPDDRILTLSTCTGYGYATRWVVQAVERKP